MPIFDKILLRKCHRFKIVLDIALFERFDGINSVVIGSDRLAHRFHRQLVRRGANLLLLLLLLMLLLVRSGLMLLGNTLMEVASLLRATPASGERPLLTTIAIHIPIIVKVS